MKSLARLIVSAFALGFSASAWAYDLSGLWSLKVENQSRHVVTTLTVEFTNQKADSCMAGNWSRVTVVSTTTENSSFYPASDPLSFQVEDNEITIGRNEICDAYAWLTGTLNEKTIKGRYYGLGLGGTLPLGFFTLTRAK